MVMNQTRKIMILTSKTRLTKVICSFLLALFLTPAVTFAQPAVSLSISPTLFEISASPAQSWSSNLRVINSNPFEIRVFTDVVNFVPQGESGQGTFVPVFAEESEGQSMAEWISLAATEYVVPAEQSAQIPFTIEVPEDAAPGGHFAAILIGTKAQRSTTGEPNVETSQVVSSLLFLRVAGDIVEDGSIREFSSERAVYEAPEVTFDLRFENKGNVHLQPQGDIKIVNMWGQERGVIPVNRQSLFGNVLPESIRKYRFTWSGEWSLADIGRYTAIATLAYGADERQFVTGQANFWVIPWKVLGGIAFVLLGFILLFTWAIKLYVRKMLSLAGVSPELQTIKTRRSTKKRLSMMAPLEAGLLDLRDRLQSQSTSRQKCRETLAFIRSYRLFFLTVFALIVFLILFVLYVQSASVAERGYEVRVDGAAGQIQFTAEDVRYDELVETREADGVVIGDVKQFPDLRLVNRSGVTGLAGELKFELEVNGYPVTEVENESGTSEPNTVIVYDPRYAEEALELSKFIGETLLSSYAESENPEYPITIYIGLDQNDTIE